MVQPQNFHAEHDCRRQESLPTARPAQQQSPQKATVQLAAVVPAEQGAAEAPESAPAASPFCQAAFPPSEEPFPVAPERSLSADVEDEPATDRDLVDSWQLGSSLIQVHET